MARVHLLLTLFWLALGVPTVLWWRDSLVYITLMSWYAIVAAHLAGWAAARAEQKVEEKAAPPPSREAQERAAGTLRRARP